MHAWMHTYTHTHACTHTGGGALTVPHLHGNAIIQPWCHAGVADNVTTSLSEDKENFGRMEYFLYLLFSSGWGTYTFKLPKEYDDAFRPSYPAG